MAEEIIDKLGGATAIRLSKPLGGPVFLSRPSTFGGLNMATSWLTMLGA